MMKLPRLRRIMYEQQNNLERALSRFGTRVEIICAMELGNKCTSKEAYQMIKEAYKELKKIKKK